MGTTEQKISLGTCEATSAIKRSSTPSRFGSSYSLIRFIRSYRYGQQISPLKTSSFTGVRILRRRRKNRSDRWLNCRVVLTICSKRTIACGLVWKRIEVKTHKGATTLHPWLNKKGKEPILPNNSDATADDKLSSGSSPLPDLPPLKNNVEAESRKRPSRRSNRFISGMHRRAQKEISKEQQQSEQALENVSTWHRGMAPSFLFVYPTFGATPTPYMLASTIVWGLEDMLSSPLGQHILSYEPPCGFVIPFTMYDSSSDLYDHMLHFNQAMILNAGDDRLLCKLFPASLKGHPDLVPQTPTEIYQLIQ